MIIEFWERDDEGRAPARRFLDKELDDYERQKVVDLIAIYEQPPWLTSTALIRGGHLKHLEEGLYELKIKTRDSHYRFPCVIDKKDRIILLDGFKKQTKRLEKKDIKRARDLYKEYKS